MVVERVSDETCQNFDRENLVFVVQRLPGVGFVEEKIEEVWISFLQWRSPSLPGMSCSRFCVKRGG
jgi:hypothetical protein